MSKYFTLIHRSLEALCNFFRKSFFPFFSLDNFYLSVFNSTDLSVVFTMLLSPPRAILIFFTYCILPSRILYLEVVKYSSKEYFTSRIENLVLFHNFYFFTETFCSFTYYEHIFLHILLHYCDDCFRLYFVFFPTVKSSWGWSSLIIFLLRDRSHFPISLCV